MTAGEIVPLVFYNGQMNGQMNGQNYINVIEPELVPHISKDFDQVIHAMWEKRDSRTPFLLPLYSPVLPLYFFVLPCTPLVLPKNLGIHEVSLFPSGIHGIMYKKMHRTINQVLV
jgi:hypothetical protein